MYLLKMLTIRLNYREKRSIAFEGGRVFVKVTPPYSIGQRCVEKDKDKTVQSIVSEHGIPDSIEFHTEYEPIKEASI